MNAITKSPAHDIEQAKSFLKALVQSATKFTFAVFSQREEAKPGFQRPMGGTQSELPRPIKNSERKMGWRVNELADALEARASAAAA